MFRCSFPVVACAVLVLFVVTRPRASATTVCDQQFDDVPSKTLLSTVVFQGRAMRSETVSQDKYSQTSNKTFSVVEFSVSRVLKGRVTTEIVSVIADCSLDVEVGAMYVVFAVDISDSSWTGLEELSTASLYQVLGQPLHSSRRVIRDVNEYACDHCGL